MQYVVGASQGCPSASQSATHDNCPYTAMISTEAYDHWSEAAMRPSNAGLFELCMLRAPVSKLYICCVSSAYAKRRNIYTLCLCPRVVLDGAVSTAKTQRQDGNSVVGCPIDGTSVTCSLTSTVRQVYLRRLSCLRSLTILSLIHSFAP